MNASTDTAQTVTYVDGRRYATDPATIAGVRVGDVVRVRTQFGGVKLPWADTRRFVDYVSVVKRVGSDEYGLYLDTVFDDTNGPTGMVWETLVSTIVATIEIVDRGEIAVGAYVTYAGTLSRFHGTGRVYSLCRCDMGDGSPDGAYVVDVPGGQLIHVDRAHLRTL